MIDATYLCWDSSVQLVMQVHSTSSKRVREGKKCWKRRLRRHYMLPAQGTELGLIMSGHHCYLDAHCSPDKKARAPIGPSRALPRAPVSHPQVDPVAINRAC